MTQPPASGRGPGEEPARDSGLPGDGAAAPGESPPAGKQSARESAPAGGVAARGSGPEAADGQPDPRLAGFAEGGPGDTCRPSAGLADRDETGHGTGGSAQRDPAGHGSSTRPDDEVNLRPGNGGHGTRGGDGSTSDGGGAGSTSDGDGSTSGGPGGSPGGPAAAPVLPALTARANLTLPLATLLGMADRPGAAHGLGPLDPALVHDLAAAASSPHSQWCLTITDGHGAAVAHGCAKPARTRENRPASRDGPAAWAFTPRDDPGPPGGYGTWTITLPGGQDFTVKLQPIPVTDCDHRHESHGYQPNDTLRPAGTSGPPPAGEPTRKGQ